MRKIFTHLCRYRVTCSLLLLLATGFFEAAASNIQVSNVMVQSVQPQNVTSSAHTIVSFTVAWENSWRVSTGPANWDAAWVFMKFRIGANDPSFTGISLTNGSPTVTLPSVANLRVGMPVRVVSGGSTLPTGTVISAINTSTNVVTLSSNATNSATNNTLEFMRIWEHAWLSTTNTHHTVNNGGSVAVGATNIDGTARGMGAFIYRSANGSGNVSYNVTLQWNFGAQAGQGTVEVQVYAIEMVYVTGGVDFNVGGGGGNLALPSTTINTANATTAPSGTGSLGGQAGGYPTGLIPPANANWPNGYNAFYCMKYETSQGQYRDFLNTLTRTQQQNLINIPGQVVGRYAVGFTYDGFDYVNNTALATTTPLQRNGIRLVADPGGSAPRTYACDLNPSSAPSYANVNEADDGEWLAMSFISILSAAAYLDWAGLRPMTELEFEKACRGTATPTANEYPWGTASATLLTSLSGNGTNNEVSNTSGANLYVNDGLGIGRGPVRVGLFATASSTRAQAGASFYGIMDMGGGQVETSVGLVTSAGRGYAGLHGDGSLSANGYANTNTWPGLVNGEVSSTLDGGYGGRGGGWSLPNTLATISDRSSVSSIISDPYSVSGFRGVRTAQ